MMKTIQLLTFALFTPSIPAKHSEMTLLGERDDELDMAMKNVPKEPEENKILLKDVSSEKTLPGELDDELDIAMKNVSKETEFLYTPPLSNASFSTKPLLSTSTVCSDWPTDPVQTEGEKISLKDVVSVKTPPKHTDKILLGERDEELVTAMKNVPKETKGEKISLKDEKILLMELFYELEKAVKILSKETEGIVILVSELQMDGCKHEFFCQAEQELIKEVSGRSGAKFELFRINRKLIRNLNMYNKHHVKTCKPADEHQYPILLHDFLINLLTCVKKEYIKINSNESMKDQIYFSSF